MNHADYGMGIADVVTHTIPSGAIHSRALADYCIAAISESLVNIWPQTPSRRTGTGRHPPCKVGVCATEVIGGGPVGAIVRPRAVRVRGERCPAVAAVIGIGKVVGGERKQVVAGPSIIAFKRFHVVRNQEAVCIGACITPHPPGFFL